MNICMHTLRCVNISLGISTPFLGYHFVSKALRPTRFKRNISHPLNVEVHSIIFSHTIVSLLRKETFARRHTVCALAPALRTHLRLDPFFSEVIQPCYLYIVRTYLSLPFNWNSSKSNGKSSVAADSITIRLPKVICDTYLQTPSDILFHKNPHTSVFHNRHKKVLCRAPAFCLSF